MKNLLFLFIFLILLAGTDLTGLSADSQFEEKVQGLSLFKSGEYAQALKSFQTWREKSPDAPETPEIFFMQGQCLRALTDWPEAVKAFARAAESSFPLSEYALFFQAEALHKGGKREESLETLERLTSLFPQSVLLPQARLRMAELSLQLKNFPKTLEVGDLVLGGKPWKDSPAQCRFLMAQAREGLEQWPEAVQAYRELWLKHPSHAHASAAKSRGEFLLREKKVAIDAVVPQALFQRSLLLYQAKSFDSALREMNRICPPEKYPADYGGEPWIDDLYFHRGMCFFHLKQYSKAVEAFDLTVRKSRNEGAAEKALFWRSQALIRTGRKEEALDSMALFQASYPASSFTAQNVFLQAAVHEDLGDSSRAVPLYREAALKFPQNSVRFGALWSAGWLSYKKGEFSAALQDWDGLKKMDPPFRWTEKVLYWKGKALERMGRAREAEESFSELLRTFPASYYSVMASSRGRAPAPVRGSCSALEPRTLAPFPETKAAPNSSRAAHLEKGKALARLHLLTLASAEFEAAEEEGNGQEEVWFELSRLYREAEEFYRSNLLVRKKFTLKPLSESPTEKERALYLLAYPLGNPSWMNTDPPTRNLDPALLCAVILEESRFHSQALSAAGARGLMQIILPTGQKAARELKIRRFTADQLFEPGLNVRLGSWYLAKLLEEFGGKVHLALAAYNAGPHMVKKWLAGGNPISDDEFVENIPYTETRNYVIRVMTSAQVYRSLYCPPGKPAQP